MVQSSPHRTENTSNDVSKDVLPRKRGRPRKDNSSTIEQSPSVPPTIPNVKKRGRPRKENAVSSPSNQGRCKSIKFFTEKHVIEASHNRSAINIVQPLSQDSGFANAQAHVLPSINTPRTLADITNRIEVKYQRSQGMTGSPFIKKKSQIPDYDARARNLYS